VVDFFFSLMPLEPLARLELILARSQTAVLELEAYPALPDEHRSLSQGYLLRYVDRARVAPPAALRFSERDPVPLASRRGVDWP